MTLETFYTIKQDRKLSYRYRILSIIISFTLKGGGAGVIEGRFSPGGVLPYIICRRYRGGQEKIPGRYGGVGWVSGADILGNFPMVN